MEGGFSGAVAISGTRSAPEWEGSIEAQDLALSSLLEGVNLKNGQLKARFAGNRLDIEQLTLEGSRSGQARILGQSGNRTAPPQSGGHLSGQGFIVYAPPKDPHSNAAGLQMDVQLQLDDLQVLTRADRQMGVSGTIHASIQQEQLRLRGGLKVNRAALLLADDSAPSLDEDVHITSAALRQQEAERQAKAARKAARDPAPEGSDRAALQPDIHLTLDSGPDFALQGYGLTTRLNGQLTIEGGPRITGEIHTDQGRYRAWGQSLDIGQGTIRFNGPTTTPAWTSLPCAPTSPSKPVSKSPAAPPSPGCSCIPILSCPMGKPSPGSSWAATPPKAVPNRPCCSKRRWPCSVAATAAATSPAPSGWMNWASRAPTGPKALPSPWANASRKSCTWPTNKA